jgi:hypothetical protein
LLEFAGTFLAATGATIVLAVVIYVRFRFARSKPRLPGGDIASPCTATECGASGPLINPGGGAPFEQFQNNYKVTHYCGKGKDEIVKPLNCRNLFQIQ